MLRTNKSRARCLKRLGDAAKKSQVGLPADVRDRPVDQQLEA